MDVPATITSKGRVTLPRAVRDALGLREGDQILFRVERGRAILSKAPDFLDLHASVPVPAAKRNAPWSRVKAETWRARKARRH